MRTLTIPKCGDAWGDGGELLSLMSSFSAQSFAPRVFSPAFFPFLQATKKNMPENKKVGFLASGKPHRYYLNRLRTQNVNKTRAKTRQLIILESIETRPAFMSTDSPAVTTRRVTTSLDVFEEAKLLLYVDGRWG